MAVIYNKKIILDYINGEDVYGIELLEDDYRFMIEVINVSNDKNMYNLCSSNVKKNYNFVKFMIDKFKKDKAFIDMIALDYLNNVDNNDITARELYYIMADIFNDRNDNRAIYYNLKKSIMYNNEKSFINAFINDVYDCDCKKEIGLGFTFVLSSDLSKSEIITKYFAERFLEEIFYENELSFEEIIHSNFSSLKKLNVYGIKNFLLDYVYRYDIALSDYLFTHIYLIEKIEKDVKKIMNDWDRYLEIIFERKNLIFKQEVDNIIDEYGVDFDYCEVCFYIDKHLNLPFKLSACGKNIPFVDIKRDNLMEYECLQKIIKLAKELYMSPVISKKCDYEEKIVKNKSCKVLKLIPKK